MVARASEEIADRRATARPCPRSTMNVNIDRFVLARICRLEPVEDFVNSRKALPTCRERDAVNVSETDYVFLARRTR